MKTTDNPKAAEALLRLADAHRKHETPREPGVHVSDLIYCRVKSWYRINLPEGTDEELSVEQLSLFLMGAGHHSVFQQCIPEKPGVLDLGIGVDVHGTPDLDLPDDPQLPGEIKTTRASAGKPPADWYYEQLAAYCLMRGINRGRLYPYFVNGVYRPKMNPILRAIDVEFTPDEMLEWEKELAYRVGQVMGPVAPDPKDPETHYTWECGYCPLNMSNGGPCAGGPGHKVGFFVDDTVPDWIK